MDFHRFAAAAWVVLACSVTSRAAAGPAVETPDEPPVETLVEPPEERYLRWLLLGERPQDAPREAPYVLSQLDGPAPEAAARIIREVLLDKENSADFGICAEAIEKYEVYDEARHLRRFVLDKQEGAKRNPEVACYWVAELGRCTAMIALLGGEDPEVAALCRKDVHAALALVYPSDGSTEGTEGVEPWGTLGPLLHTLWLLGAEDDLRKLAASAKRWRAGFEERFPYEIRTLPLNPDGTGGGKEMHFLDRQPTMADWDRRSLDENVARMCEQLLVFMRTRRDADDGQSYPCSVFCCQ